MVKWYILKNKIPVDCTMLEAAIWMNNFQNCIVEQTEIGNVKISTVFLGLDHSHYGGPPILFETMIFGGKEDEYQRRYTTWDDAVIGHKEACNLVLSTFSLEADELKKVIIETLN